MRGSCVQSSDFIGWNFFYSLNEFFPCSKKKNARILATQMENHIHELQTNKRG